GEPAGQRRVIPGAVPRAGRPARRLKFRRRKAAPAAGGAEPPAVTPAAVVEPRHPAVRKVPGDGERDRHLLVGVEDGTARQRADQLAAQRGGGLGGLLLGGAEDSRRARAPPPPRPWPS